jgi:Tfp pilus assembly protein PilF
VWATDEYHAIHLKDKPDSPETHSNYGAYLLDKKGDMDGAERAFRKALTIDRTHANALGNLANVMDRRGKADEADALYRQALTSARGQENASYNYVTFLRREKRASTQIREIVESGVRQSPDSGRLQLLLGEIEILDGHYRPALAAFRRARELGADQAAVEAGYAVALHVSCAPIEDCIAAYRTAIALNPTSGGLHLNIAQLLFAAGRDEQARPMLERAWQLELDPSSQLEAHFYAIAHMPADIGAVASSLRRLLESGTRMNWNVAMTLERARAGNPTRADVLGQLREVLVGRAPLTKLAELVQQLSV